MLCENCGFSITSFLEYWIYEKENKDKLIFCCEECYDKGSKDFIKCSL